MNFVDRSGLYEEYGPGDTISFSIRDTWYGAGGGNANRDSLGADPNADALRKPWKLGNDPQNPGDHEFAHSQVRCPPTADQLLNDSKIKAAIKEALTRGLKLRLEHGGWIYWNRITGRTFAIIKQPTIDPLNASGKADRWEDVYLDSPPSPPKGTVIVGQFHVHLEPVGPSGDFDNWAADQFKTPGIHMDSTGRMSIYGNYKRGIWNTDLPPGCR